MPLRDLKRRLRAVIPSVLFLLLAAYFGWNATRGTLGLRAYAARQGDLAQANSVLAAALTDEIAWRNRLAGLEPAHLDPDALDERARQMLNLSAPDDIIVPTHGK